MTVFVFKFRWLFLAMGAAFGIGALVLKSGRPRPWARALAKQLALARAWAEPRFGQGLGILALGWITIAVSAKFLQLESLTLNSMDFWLFEDMLRSLREGAAFITRFAPQGLGPVQHGAVHATFSWALALPLSLVFGPTAAALLYGPLALGAAALLLASIARLRLGALGAWGLAAAFLASSQVGRVLTYDTHPESAYPFFVALYAWGAYRGNLPAALAGLLGGMGVKEDAFLIFLPLTVVLPFGSARKLGLLAIGGLLGALSFAFILGFRHGLIGPQSWLGLPVLIPAQPGFLQGQSWDSPTQVIQALVSAHGGWGSALRDLGKFFVSRPWLSLLALAPWLIREPRLWIALIPVGAAHALIGGIPSTLILYYSAAFIGTFWVFAATSAKTRMAWLLPASLLLGSGGPEFPIPSPIARQISSEARQLSRCLKPGAPGIVTTPLLPFAPRQNVWTDRLPQNPLQWEQTKFVFFAPQAPRFETSEAEIMLLLQEVKSSESWQRIGWDCQPVPNTAQINDAVLLYRKISPSSP